MSRRYITPEQYTLERLERETMDHMRPLLIVCDDLADAISNVKRIAKPNRTCTYDTVLEGLERLLAMYSDTLSECMDVLERIHAVEYEYFGY